MLSIVIDVTEVDERDSTWEDSRPRFRVYVHDGDGPGGSTATYDVAGADVLQVVDWAQRRAGSSLTYAVALVVDRPAPVGIERGLVWLVGMDGNSEPLEGHEADILRRMVARQGHVVVLPESDRA